MFDVCERLVPPRAVAVHTIPIAFRGAMQSVIVLIQPMSLQIACEVFSRPETLYSRPPGHSALFEAKCPRGREWRYRNFNGFY